MDFENWTKDQWDAINGKTWSTIKRFCIPRGVWIEDYENNGSRSEILMKLVSATNYDIELKDWDMDRIRAVENTYSKVSRGIALPIQALQGNRSDGAQIQKFNDIPFQTPPQQPSVEPLYLTLSNTSPYLYQPHQPQQPEQPHEQQQPTYRHQSIYGYQPMAMREVQYAYEPQHAYENHYKPDYHQPAPTRTFNQAPQAKEASPAKLLPVLTTSVPAPSTQAPPAEKPSPVQEAFLAQVPSVQVSPAQAEASPLQIPQAYVPPTEQAPPVHAPVTEAPQAQASPIPASPAQVFPASTLQAYTSGLVNHLLNYETAHKSIQPSYLYENGDDKLYFTDCHYRNGKFKRQDLCYHRKKRMKTIDRMR